MFSRPARILSVTSLILMAVTLAMWMRSLGWRDGFQYNWSGQRWETVSYEGRIRSDNEPEQALIYNKAMREIAGFQSELAFINAHFPSPADAQAWNDTMNRISILDRAVEDRRAVAERVQYPGNPEFVASSISYPRLLAYVSMVPATQLVFLLLSAPLIAWKHLRYRRTWAARGRCSVCGYDLCASPSHCPECGTKIRTAHPHPIPAERTPS